MSEDDQKKERTTISVDPSVKAFLGEDGRNASETVNKLVKMEMGKDGFNQEYLRSRMEDHEDKYYEAANKAKRHLKRYNELQDRLNDLQKSENEQLEEALEKCEDIEWSVDNNGIQTQAAKVELSPEEFIEELEKYHD